MKILCNCGCGQEVKSPGAKFVRGHHNRSEEVKKKKRETCLKNYGVEYSFQSKECREKGKQTCIVKYGTEYPSQNEEVKQKSKEVWIKNYGVNNPSKSPLIKEKKRISYLKALGVEHPLKCQNIKDQIKQSNLKKYGGTGFESDQLSTKTKQTMLKKYKVDNYSKTPQFQELARKVMIQRLKEQVKNGDIISPMIGRLEPEFFKWLQQLTKCEIVRPDKDMFGCFPDGYIKELKMVIEFDEPHHKETRNQKRDQYKNDIYQRHDLHIFRIDQEKWKQDPEVVKEEFQDLVQKLEVNFPNKN